MDFQKLTVLDLLERAASQFPGNPAAVTAQKTWTHAELLASSQAVGRALAQQAPGQTVALFFPMSAEFAAAYFGVLYAGKQVLPLNLLLQPEELKFILQDAGAQVVVAPPMFVPKLAPLGVQVIDFAELCKPSAAAGEMRKGSPDDVCTLLYTSGTTGKPKGVELTHWNLASNALSSVETMRMDPGHRFLACLPSFHTFAITATMVAPLAVGGSFAPLPKFDPELIVSTTADLKCNTLLMVPSMYRLITRMQERKPRDMKHLRLAIAGGEALPADTRDGFERVFGLPLLEGYGQTETSPIIAFNMPWANKAGTVGKPLAHVQVRVVDPETQRELPPDTTGEIWISGPSVMKGYHNRPDETAKVLTPDGWLRTGDMGELTPDGYLRITGRLREMVKVSGEMVFPAEVENALLQHPAIQEAGVAGVKDERKGEIVQAFVVLKAGVQATAEELLAHCRTALAAYKVPRAIEFRNELPKGPTGKVLRRLLR